MGLPCLRVAQRPSSRFFSFPFTAVEDADAVVLPKGWQSLAVVSLSLELGAAIEADWGG